MLTIRMGALAPSVAKQVAAQGGELQNAELFERVVAAYNLLRCQAFLSDSEAKRVAQRIVREVSKATTGCGEA